MKIALISWRKNKVSSQDRDEIHLIEKHLSRKHEVINISGKENTETTLDAALMRIPDYINVSDAEEAAWEIWDRGVPFLVSPLQRRLARNKLYSHRLFAEHEIQEPLWSMNPDDLSGETVSKPLCGGRSIDVVWHKKPPKINPGQHLLFQEYRKPLALWRSIASPEKVVLAYKKVSKEKIISVSSGAEREILPAPEELEKISKAMATALGGGLWGLDVIEDAEGFWALEANMNFGYPLDYAGQIADEIAGILYKRNSF